MTKITIPTEGEFQDRLSGLEQLLTATQWERAAIVYAFTEPGEGQGALRGPRAVKFPCSMAQFAQIGIKGLQSDRTVRDYRQRYADAVKAGEQPIAVPGKTINVNTELDWEPTGHTSAAATNRPFTQQVAEAKRLLEDPQVAREVLAEPKVAKAVTGAVDDHREAEYQQHVGRVEAKRQREVGDPAYHERVADLQAKRDADPTMQAAEQAEAYWGLTERLSKVRVLLGDAVKHAADLHTGKLEPEQRESINLILEGINQRLRWVESTVGRSSANLTDEIAEFLTQQ